MAFGRAPGLVRAASAVVGFGAVDDARAGADLVVETVVAYGAAEGGRRGEVAGIVALGVAAVGVVS